jgi:hypothetical protein
MVLFRRIVISITTFPFQYLGFVLSVTGGTGTIPLNTYVVSYTSTTLVMNNNATASGTVEFSIVIPNIQSSRNIIDDLDNIKTNKTLGWS